MVLKELFVNKFRNIDRAVVKFNSGFNIFHGKNGQGKTNYLESLFFIGTLKSFRNAKQKDMLSWNEHASHISCTVNDNNLTHDLSVTFENSSKNAKIDGKTAPRIVEYCKILSIVAFCPEEISMINGSPDQRRRYLDRAIFSSDAGYLKTYHNYYRILKQRNHLLKQGNYVGIEAWTEQLALSGAILTLERSQYIAKLSETFSGFYKSISGSDEEVGLWYHNSSLKEGLSLDEIRSELLREILRSSRIERERGTTVIGPHRDDLELYLNERLIKEHGSQGQQKSFVMALKMAEIDYLYRVSAKVPVLLLDDMTAELDSNRIEHLINFLVQREMQVFISTTDKTSVPLPDKKGCADFYVENGRIV